MRSLSPTLRAYGSLPLNHWLCFAAIGFAFLCMSSTTPAATINVGNTKAAGLDSAIKRAGVGGTVNLTGNITMDRTVIINTKNVTILGKGKSIIEQSGKQISLLVVRASGVRIFGVKFRAVASNKFRAMVVPEAANLRIRGCAFFNGSAGIRNVGEPPRGLNVSLCTFNNVPIGIAFNRDVVRMSGNNKVNRALDGGRFEIVNNTFNNATGAGITIDAGNDGGSNKSNSIAGNGDPSFPSQDSPLRASVNGRTTDFYVSGQGRSLIKGNTITGIRAFGIALARVNGINVFDNNLTVSKNGNAFRRGIHLENRTNGITVAGNTIKLNGGAGVPGGIGMAAFTDYGNPRRFANGVRRITFNKNTVTGTGAGFAGAGFAGITITNNNLTGVSQKYVFFNVQGIPNNFKTRSGNKPFNP